jgi:sodium transport system permease protein
LIVGTSFFEQSQREEAVENVYEISVNDGELLWELTTMVPPSFNVSFMMQGDLKGPDGTLIITKEDSGRYFIKWEQRTDRNRNIILNELMNSWIRQVNEKLLVQYLVDSGLDTEMIQPINFEVIDVTPVEQRQDPLTGLLSYFMGIGIIVGGMSIAIDATTGEKERKTLLTLYASPHSAAEIMFAKLLSVSFFAIISSILNVVSLVLSLTYVMDVLNITNATNLEISIDTSVKLITLMLPFAIMMSCLMIALGIYARTIKEATASISPLVFAVIFIGITFSAIDATPWSWMYWTPVVNVFVTFKDALLYQLTLGHWLLTIGTQFIMTGIILAITHWLFRQESVLFRQ